MKEINELLEIMQRLRDPENGCPWDREQTMQSILPYTLEEIYELVDCIERNDTDELCSELGDLLFHVVYYAQIADEAGLFSFKDVNERINAKLRRRHPHVFAGSRVGSVKEQTIAWEKIKEEERKEKGGGAGNSKLDGINQALPAMSRGYKLQKRAASAGFDWENLSDVLAKIEEELDELKAEIHPGNNSDKLEDEIGDLIFTCINFARHAQIDPETALRKTNHKFEQRFRYIEKKLMEENKEVTNVSLDKMEALWQEAKKTDLE